MQQSIRQTYNQIAHHFSRSRTKIWPDMGNYLGKLKKGNSVLDIGCGNGRLLYGMRDDVEYLGIDFSHELIKQAKKLHPENTFLLGDITDPQTWSKLKKYDAIFCVSVLHHFPDRKQQLNILKQAKSHLKTDGFLYLSVWNLWKKNRIIHHFRHGSLRLKIKNPRWINTLFQNKWKMFCFAFDKKYLADLISESELIIIDIYYTKKSGKTSGILNGQNLIAVTKR